MEIMFLPPPFLTNYVYFMEFEFISPPLSPVLGYKMSKLSGNPFVSHGRIQDTMTYDILAIGVKWGSVPPPFYFSLRTGSLEEDSGGRRRREGEGGEGGVDPGIG
jgi:hypothetical protein